VTILYGTFLVDKVLIPGDQSLVQSAVARSRRHITQDQITFVLENPMATFLRGEEEIG